MEYDTFPIYLGSQEHTNEKGEPQDGIPFRKSGKRRDSANITTIVV